MKRTISALCIVAAAISILIHPEVSRIAVEEGIALCQNALLPSLFPFLILTGLWNSLGMAGNGLISQIWLPAAIGGYPTGASLIAEAYRNGSISKSSAEHALFFCCNAGPAFIIGFLGVRVLDSLAAGVFLYLIHLMTALMLGFLFRPQGTAETYPGRIIQKDVPFDITDHFLQAGKTMGKICVLVIAFEIISAQLLTLFPKDLQDTTLTAVLHAGLELTGGIHRLSKRAIPLPSMLILCAVLLGWGGSCVCFQTLSLLRGTDLSLRPYIIGKLMHGILSGAAVCLFFTSKLSVFLFLLLPAVFLLGKSFTGKKALHGL